MYMFFRIFNNVILMLVNFLIAIYFGRRFFLVMTRHYKLVGEIAEFNLIVKEARDSLDYITTKISALMKDLEGDIGEELSITHNLTELSSKMAILLKRYGEIEERVLELVRMNENMANAQIETPEDIKSEARRIIMKMKKSKLESYTKTLTPTTENILTS